MKTPNKYFMLEGIAIAVFCLVGIPYISNVCRESGNKRLLELHKSLPSQVQEYDTNNDGVLDKRELSILVRDYDFAPKHRTNYSESR